MKCIKFDDAIYSQVFMIIVFIIGMFILGFIFKATRSNFIGDLNTPIEKQNENVIICGIVRDAADNVEKNLDSLYQVGKKFNRFKIIIVENDSIDGTDKICKRWAEKHNYGGEQDIILISDHLDPDDMDLDPVDKSINQNFSKRRFQKMAYVRNIYMDEMEKIPWFEDPETLVVMVDLDLKEIPVNNVMNAINKDLDWNVLCANGIERRRCYNPNDTMWGIPAKKICTFRDSNKLSKYGNKGLGKYYDSLALRFMDDDGQTFANLPVHVPDEDPKEKERLKNHEIRSWTVFNSPNDNPLEVRSCFGGLSIYKSEVLLGLRYSGYDCEHVSVNNQIPRKIFTLPEFVVYYD
jgi:hypothetical protein